MCKQRERKYHSLLFLTLFKHIHILFLFGRPILNSNNKHISLSSNGKNDSWTKRKYIFCKHSNFGLLAFLFFRTSLGICHVYIFYSYRVSLHQSLILMIWNWLTMMLLIMRVTFEVNCFLQYISLKVYRLNTNM